MTGAVPDGCVRLEENLDRSFCEILLVDKVLEKSERGKRIVKSIMPGFSGGMSAKVVQSQRGAEISERVRFFTGPSSPGQLKSIDPRPEGVAWERTQKTFFSSVAMSNDWAMGELFFQDGPQRQEGWGV